MWRQTYSKLTEFVHKNPQIQITAEKTIIPQDVRQQFWQTFDETRREFIKQNFSNFIEETSLLGENYVKTEKEIISLLNLEEIALPQPLKEFIQNPEKALMRELFDPLFDLLKGKIDAETFEEGSSKKVTESIKKYYPKAYILWLELSIMKLLEPDKVFQVPIPKVTIRHARVFLRYAQVRMWDVPHPKETKTISLEHNVASTFIVPDFIIHSKRLNRFMAFRSEAGTAVWTASNPSEKREWIPIPPASVRLGYLDILIYMDETPDNINLTADSGLLPKFLLPNHDEFWKIHPKARSANDCFNGFLSFQVTDQNFNILKPNFAYPIHPHPSDRSSCEVEIKSLYCSLK